MTAGQRGRVRRSVSGAAALCAVATEQSAEFLSRTRWRRRWRQTCWVGSLITAASRMSLGPIVNVIAGLMQCGGRHDADEPLTLSPWRQSPWSQHSEMMPLGRCWAPSPRWLVATMSDHVAEVRKLRGCSKYSWNVYDASPTVGGCCDRPSARQMVGGSPIGWSTKNILPTEVTAPVQLLSMETSHIAPDVFFAMIAMVNTYGTPRSSFTVSFASPGEHCTPVDLPEASSALRRQFGDPGSD